MVGSSFQFVYFLILTSLGVISGIIYDFIYCVVYFCKFKIVYIIRDILFFIVVLLLYFRVLVKFNMPNFRLYQPVCFLLGFILYIKSFHKAVDFLCKKVYNFIRIKLIKIGEKFKNNDSRKKRKAYGCNNGVSGANTSARFYNNDIPNGKHSSKKKRIKGSKSRNC